MTLKQTKLKFIDFAKVEFKFIKTRERIEIQNSKRKFNPILLVRLTL